MRLTNQRKLAAQVFNCAEKRVWFDTAKLNEIKEAITKNDIRSLINQGMIGIKAKKGISRGRTRKNKQQKSKGKQKGPGSRKGKATARLDPKYMWMNRVRLQRSFLKRMKQKKIITTLQFSELYKKSKGGFFRSLRHLKLYMEEHDILKNKQ